MIGSRLCLVVMSLLSLQSVALADKASGPAVNESVPALKVHFAVPDETGEVSDVVARRGTKPTIYVIVPAEHWSRPAARFLKTLDNKINAVHSDAKIVVVWLSDDIEAAREYLPRAQSSIKLQDTFWTVYNGAATGPKSWDVDLDTDATIVITNGGKVIATKRYDPENKMLADSVLAKLKQSLSKE